MSDKSESLVHELLIASSIVKLAAFAAEARRTLEETDDVLRNVFPELRKQLHGCLTNPYDWIEHEDAAGLVLISVGRKLEELAADIGKPQ